LQYKTILFDMDGTTLDTAQDIADSLNHIFRLYGLPEVSLRRTMDCLGNGARMLIEQAAPPETKFETIEEMLTRYTVYYEAHCRIKTGPYPGMTELMAKLRAAGKQIAIISNKPDGAVKQLADELFSGLVDAAIGESDDIRRKPWPDMVLKTMAELGAKPEECVYIGDTEVDMLTAKNSGLPCISVAWGFRSAAQLVERGADPIVYDMDELAAVLGV